MMVNSGGIILQELEQVLKDLTNLIFGTLFMLVKI